MRKWLAIGLVVAASIGCSLGIKQIQTDPTRVINRVQASVVRITGVQEDGPYTCSGFVVRPQLVLTANHCLGVAMTADGGPTWAIRHSDTHTDLALLVVATPKRPLTFRGTDVGRFDTVHGIGYALGATYLTVSFSRVMAVHGMLDGLSLPGLVVTPAYISGMSGGPVVDEYGEVVAMAQDADEGVGYGVEVAIMQAFLVGL